MPRLHYAAHRLNPAVFPPNGKGMSVLILVERRSTLSNILEEAQKLIESNGVGAIGIDPLLDRVTIEFIRPRMKAKTRTRS